MNIVKQHNRPESPVKPWLLTWWPVIAPAVVTCIGIGAYKADSAYLKADVQELRKLDLPTVKARADTIERIAGDVNEIKVEQARQAKDLSYIARQLDRQANSD